MEQGNHTTAADETNFAVPAALRGGRFIPKAGPGRRDYRMVMSPETGEPVSSYAAGKAQDWWGWSPEIDAEVAENGAELRGDGLILVDCDVPLLPDGTPAVDGFRRLTDFATEAGCYPDVNEWLMVRTPGHWAPGRTPKGPGWHVWFRDDPEFPVRTGALERCRAIEIKKGGTCPSSPGYEVKSDPAELPVMPRWLAELAGMATPGDTTTGYAGFSEWGDGQRDWAEFMKEKARTEAGQVEEARAEEAAGTYQCSIHGPQDKYLASCYKCNLARELAARKARVKADEAEHGPASEITDQGISDLLALPEPACLADGVIQDESIVLIHGPQGSMKTFVTLDLMLKMSGPGGMWLGRRVMKTGPCAFFAGEGMAGLGVRVQGWVAGNNGKKPAGFHAPRHNGLSLLISADVNSVIEYLKSTSPDGWLAVVFDAKADFMDGDEDKEGDTSRFIAAIRRIRAEANVRCVIIIAHPGNQNQHRARGSSRQGNAFDTILRVMPGHVTDDPQRGGKQRDLMPSLAADFHPEPAGPSLVIRSGTDLGYMNRTYGNSGGSELDGAIITVVRDNSHKLNASNVAHLLRHEVDQVPVQNIGVTGAKREESFRAITRRIDVLLSGEQPVLRRDGAGHLSVTAEDEDDHGDNASGVGHEDPDQ